MRVLILSDTHGALDPAIEALVRTCDIAVHAGDVGNAAILDALQAACGRVVAVRGNNDVPSKWPPHERATVDRLQDVAHVDVPGGTLIATHGDRFSPASRHARLRAAFPGARAIVFGHSHRLIVDDAVSPWVLNPGAAGHARTFGGPSCLILTASEKRWRVEPHRFAAARSLSGR